MFLNENNNQEEEVNLEDKYPNIRGTESEVTEIVLEAQMSLHNIEQAMIKVEHVSIMNEDEEKLSESVSDYAKKMKEWIKKFWDKIKAWYNKAMSKIGEWGFEKAVDKYADDAKKAEGEVEMKIYDWDTDALNPFFNYSVEDMLDLIDKGASSVNDFLEAAVKDMGIKVNVSGGFSSNVKKEIRGEKKTRDINNSKALKSRIEFLESYKKNSKSMKQSYKTLKQLVKDTQKDLKDEMGEEEKKEIKQNKALIGAAFRLIGAQFSLKNSFGTESVRVIRKLAKAADKKEDDDSKNESTNIQEDTDEEEVGILDQYMN